MNCIAIWLLINILASIITFHSLGGDVPQHLNNWLNTIFALSALTKSIPALKRDPGSAMCRPA